MSVGKSSSLVRGPAKKQSADDLFRSNFVRNLRNLLDHRKVVSSAEVGKILKVTDIMIAHNAAFDAPFLAYELLRLGQPVNQDMEVFCTMQAGRFATPLGKPPRLVELCWALGVPFVAEDAHRAIYDVDRMMEAVSVGIAKGYFDFKPVLEKITQQRLAKAA